MAEDNSQRPFRSIDPHGRATPTANTPAAGNDPLAELARLIGQSDPFGEFGRDSAPPPAAPQAPSQPEPMLRALAAQAMPRGAHAAAGEHGAEVLPGGYGGEDYARQPYGSPPLAGGDDVYHMQDGPVPGYEDHAGYQEAGYEPGPPPYAGDEHGYQDYYDDLPPPRRRMGVLAIAAVFALAVLGTAGAFGYRALFGSVRSGPPPVIKADAKPAKIVPDKDKNQAAKLINDRVNDGAQKLVSREEQPVDLNKDPAAGVMTQGQSMANAGAGAMQTPALGSGVIGPDPRKIKTITIRPNQPMVPTAGTPAPAPTQADVADATPAAPARPLAPAQPAAQPPAHAAQAAPAPRSAAPAHRAAPAPTRRVARAPASNAPLSLSPDAVAPTRVARAPTSLAAGSSARPATSASGGYAVQISSRRSEADARAALSRMQSRFSSVIGGQRVMIKRVDLAGKGVYYRAMIGPFGSSSDASSLCSRLKAAGGSCFVQKM